MAVMHDPIEDRVGERGFAEVGVPGLDRQLTGEDRRSTSRELRMTGMERFVRSHLITANEPNLADPVHGSQGM